MSGSRSSPWTRRRWAAAAALLIGSGGRGASAQTGIDTESLVALIRRYEGALAQADVETVMELYSSDPVFMPEFAPAAVGRRAIRAAYGEVFKALDLRGVFHIDEVTVAGDLAWARTHSTGDFTVRATGATAAVGNNEFFLFRREPSGWRIHRYMFTANKPPSS